MTDALYGIGLNLPLIFAFGVIVHTVVARLAKKRKCKARIAQKANAVSAS